MPRLDFYVSFKLYVKIRLSTDQVLIGRSADCDIQLPHDRVSRVHAAIVTTPEGSHMLEDRSANGTRVNDGMVSGSRPLSPGDRIYIEDYTLVYKPDGSEPEEIDQNQTFFA